MPPIAGIIYCLDLASRTGFAKGRAGECPRSGVVELKTRGDSQDSAFGNLIAFLVSEWSRERPEVVVVEAPMTLEAFRLVHSSQDNVEFQYGLHGIVRGMSRRFGLETKRVHPATVRRHFLGQAHMGSREETKLAVVNRCHLLRLMPKDCVDDNRADAIATWDFAAATYGRRMPHELYLFGEGGKSATSRPAR